MDKENFNVTKLFISFSETLLNQTSLGPPFQFRRDMCSVIQVKLTKISYIESWFKVSFIQDSGLFRVWLRQVCISPFNHWDMYSSSCSLPESGSISDKAYILDIQWNLCDLTPEFSDILWLPIRISGPKIFLLHSLLKKPWVFRNLSLPTFDIRHCFTVPVLLITFN